MSESQIIKVRTVYREPSEPSTTVIRMRVVSSDSIPVDLHSAREQAAAERRKRPRGETVFEQAERERAAGAR
ncbi:hypothetical protein [Streptomyces sp. NPDC046909]|uniref:hypothetical protein n=1 Tax=Streptomyces sp. NPDC046909 TaxID=3155617 RepID=UPI0033E54835